MFSQQFTHLKRQCLLIMAEVSTYRVRLILDLNKQVGNHAEKVWSIKTDLCKEDVARTHIFGRTGVGMKFLDIGAGDGELRYLLGITRNMKFVQSFYDSNLKTFNSKYQYFGVDLESQDLLSPQLLGDVSSPDFLVARKDLIGEFDVVYSNNVFEHLDDPFCAARNVWSLCRDGGLIVTIVPFAQRFHESPDDYFRYTHRGIEKIFEAAGGVKVIESGYDITGRRNNWQGSGSSNDIVPRDNFGAWRETWFTVCVLQKIAS